MDDVITFTNNTILPVVGLLKRAAHQGSGRKTAFVAIRFDQGGQANTTW
jgi:hypothetical protein